MMPVEVVPGDGPVVLAMPHVGVDVPYAVAATLNAAGRALADTDWAVDTLYDGLCPRATIVRATFHRYVIDANRDPSGASLYPGQNTTGLCPTTTFDGEPIYAAGQEPNAGEIARRLATYHTPYHAALAAELERVRNRHGVVLLYDCHSIRSTIPYLFDGKLPDFNIGTDGGTTCAPALETVAVRTCADATQYSTVLNGRFKGGWTTRNYSQPTVGRHAIQMELAQSTYLDEAPPWAYRTECAARLRPVLARLLLRLETAVVKEAQ